MIFNKKEYTGSQVIAYMYAVHLEYNNLLISVVYQSILIKEKALSHLFSHFPNRKKVEI